MDKRVREVANNLKPSPEKIDAAKNLLKKNGKYIIGGIIIVCVVMFLVLSKARTNAQEKNYPMLVKKPRDASKQLFIESENVPDLSTGEVTLGLWVYLNKISTERNFNHHIISLGAPEGSPYLQLSFFPQDHSQPNHIRVYVKHNGAKSVDDTDVQSMCNLASIPLKKWCYITVSVWAQNVDVYLNGKLARSCVLPTVPDFVEKTNHNVYITHPSNNSQGGFDGYLSRVMMSNRSISPEHVYNNYVKGPFSSSWWSSLSQQEEEVKCPAEENAVKTHQHVHTHNSETSDNNDNATESTTENTDFELDNYFD